MNVTLLHERSDGEPETVDDGELVLILLGVLVAGVGVHPLIGREPGSHEQNEAHAQVGSQHVHPYLGMLEHRHVIKNIIIKS